MIGSFFATLFLVLSIFIFARVILSWLPVLGVYLDPYNPFIRFIHQVTEPILEPLRRLIPPIGGTLDITPIVALILLQILERVAYNVG